jgi:pyruvate kinase
MTEPDPASPRRTKIVATIGPGSVGRIAELVAAGMDVARVNLSHGTPASRAEVVRGVRDAAGRAGRAIAVMADLSGPKIRLGDLAGGELELEADASFELRPDPAAGLASGDERGAAVSEPALAGDLRPGDRILLADGAVELTVVGTAATISTRVVRGGTIRSRAGVSVPSGRLSAPALTARDRADLAELDALGVDFIAQSFVRRGEDVAELRRFLGEAGPPIVAKIETRPAVEAFDAILEVADAVMIARGDLGVELPFEAVPIVQKQLVRRALDRGRPTIVATQMLESMTAAPRPTRAEASDVANAVIDGTDALLLSAETAIGAYPVLAVAAADRIARRVERDGAGWLAPGAPPAADTDAGALAYAAVALVLADTEVEGIACYTRTGQTARLLSALRPRVPIFAFAPDDEVVRRLTLVHGVVPLACPPGGADAARLGLLAERLAAADLVSPGGAAVLVASTAEPGSGPNLLEVHRVPG